MVLKRFFGKRASVERSRWATPAGMRVYAVGDIHGRLDLLNLLLERIDADDQARGPSTTILVFLGDLPDRGPDSRGVVERLMQLEQGQRQCIFLSGNHEELLIRLWEGEREIAATFNRAGGRETLISYGVAAETYDAWDLDDVTKAAHSVVPAEHIAFLKGFRDWYTLGDYLFVHAGIRPGIPVEDQDVVDLRWIRGDFIRSNANHGMMVVHGHTITAEADEQPNRIGIDTGAFASGVLTAIGLEGTERWFIAT